MLLILGRIVCHYFDDNMFSLTAISDNNFGASTTNVTFL